MTPDSTCVTGKIDWVMLRDGQSAICYQPSATRYQQS
jgi:hypothetical protein